MEKLELLLLNHMLFGGARIEEETILGTRSRFH